MQLIGESVIGSSRPLRSAPLSTSPRAASSSVHTQGSASHRVRSHETGEVAHHVARPSEMERLGSTLEPKRMRFGRDEAALLAIESSLDRRGVVTMLIEPRPLRIIEKE